MKTAEAQPDLAVQFRLSDADNEPVALAHARLVLGSAAGWQLPTAGQAIQTDASGESRATFAHAVEYRPHKRPTNFVDSLFRRAEPADHVQAAVELVYAARRRLVVVQLYRFRRDGAVLMGGFEVYTPDASGRFTVQGVCVDGHSWRIPEPDGTQTGHPGFDLVEFDLKPPEQAVDSRHWSLKLGFRRLPEPVRR